MTAEEMKDHAQRMAQLFPPDKALNECECCHRHSAELRTIFKWRGIYQTVGESIASMIGTAITIVLMRHVFHFLFPYKHVDFSTSHSFCNDCFAQIKRRKLVGNIVKQICLTFIILAAMIIAIMGVFVVLVVFQEPTKETIAIGVVGLCCGLICLVAGLVAQDRIVRWCIPTTVRFISKPPFELIGFQKI